MKYTLKLTNLPIIVVGIAYFSIFSWNISLSPAMRLLLYLVSAITSTAIIFLQSRLKIIGTLFQILFLIFLSFVSMGWLAILSDKYVYVLTIYTHTLIAFLLIGYGIEITRKSKLL